MKSEDCDSDDFDNIVMQNIVSIAPIVRSPKSQRKLDDSALLSDSCSDHCEQDVDTETFAVPTALNTGGAHAAAINHRN
eukprot:5832329-Pleurochrysis_carterae.AAC.1